MVHGQSLRTQAVKFARTRRMTSGTRAGGQRSWGFLRGAHPAPQGLLEILGLHRLGHEVVHAHVTAAIPVSLISARGHGNDRHVTVSPGLVLTDA